jgi:hypothetical protein
MPADPLESLRQPIAPLAPRPEFSRILRERVAVALGLQPERSDAMSTVSSSHATQAVTPYLTVHDAAGALAFYAAGFGAVEQMRVAAEGRIGHSEFTIGAARFMLSDEYPDIGVVSPRAVPRAYGRHRTRPMAIATPWCATPMGIAGCSLSRSRT